MGGANLLVQSCTDKEPAISSIVDSERPVCECHGEPMRWNKDARNRRGGYWQCAVKRLESDRRYREAYPDRKRESNRRWRDANPVKVAAHNARTMRVCGIYVGMCGWTETEIKEMTSGATH